MSNIGFIGTGNMAQAIAVKLSQEANTQLLAYSPTEQKLNVFCQQFGAIKQPDNQNLVMQSDIVILAVKPQMMTEILLEIKPVIQQKLLITIAAGLTLDDYHRVLPHCAIVRAMPNINAAVAESMTAITSRFASAKQLTEATTIFDAIGKTIQLPEDKFSIFTALAGSSPAYIFLMIDTLAKAGVKHGLSKTQATEIVCQMMLGSIKLIQHTQQHPQALIDTICSPNGTTIAGYCELENYQFNNSLFKAIDAVIARDKQLSQQNEK